MTDGTTPAPDSGASADPTSTENKVEVDGAELTALREASARLGKLDATAKEAQRENAEDYLDDLEEALLDRLDTNAPANTTPAPEPATPATPAAPAAAPQSGLTDADREAINAARQASAQAFLATQRLEYNNLSSIVPEAERTTATVAELDKIIKGEGALIGALLNKNPEKFSGNVYMAAEHIHEALGDRKKATKAGAAAQAARNSAAATSQLSTGGTTAEPTTGTPEERALAVNKKHSDEIAPDDDYVYPG